MTLNELTIRGFGKFHDRHYTFSDGLNVLYGKNESGKSTLHAFLRAMFFGMERARGRASKTDFYAHFEPWAGDGAYGGSMKITQDGHIYRIDRNFAKNPLDLTVTDETAGKELEDPQAFMKQILGDLSLTAYDNTVSIGQLKSATDKGMVNELRNYIANMNTSGNMSLNITKASAYLKDQRRAFEQRIVQDAAKNYAANLSEIRRLEEQISSPDYVNQIPVLTECRDSAAQAVGTLQKEKERLLQKSAADRQVLRGKRFEDREEINSFVSSAGGSLKAYQEAKQLAAAGGTGVALTVAGLLAAAFLAAGIYFSGGAFAAGGSGGANMPLNALCFLAAAICAAVCIYFYRIRADRQKAAKDAGNAFLDKVRFYFPELLPMANDPEADCAAVMESVRKETDSLLQVCDSVDQSDQLLKEIDGRLERLRTQQSDADAGIEQQHRSQWQLEQSLEHLSNLKDESAALKVIVEENERLRTEMDAIDIAQETMTRLASTIRDSFGLYLNRNASDLIAGITGGIYTSLSIDQDLNVFLNTETKLIPLEQVSSGTMDQVYLALRLAAADLMQQEGVQLPLFLDDSFVNYDEDRLRTVLKWLPETYPDRQVLIFSCHRREAQLMSANLIPYTLTEIA